MPRADPTLAYPPVTVRLVEIRLLEGPNVYRLVPVVKVEVVLGRRRAWHGDRQAPGVAALGRAVPARDWPDPIMDLVAWTRRLRLEYGESAGPLTVHRSSDPGAWILAWPWLGAERTRTIAEAALDLSGRNVSSLRRVTTSQRDVVGRLARREFVDIGSEMALRFRDVHDHLVRLNDEAFLFQDRITGILDAHLSNVSNRLNQVMKVLTVMTTVFMPLTLLSGLWGMNVPLPHFPGGEAMQFWWLIGIMLVIALSMLGLFRRLRWI